MIKVEVEEGDVKVEEILLHSESEEHALFELVFETKYPRLWSSNNHSNKQGRSQLTLSFVAEKGGPFTHDLAEGYENPTKITFHGLGGRSWFDHDLSTRYRLSIGFYRHTDKPKTVWSKT